jgi:hypothetical protein
MESTRITDCYAIGHYRQGHNNLAFVMHAHHLVLTPVLDSRLYYPAVQRAYERESEDIREPVLLSLTSTARARCASSVLCQSY